MGVVIFSECPNCGKWRQEGKGRTLEPIAEARCTCQQPADKPEDFGTPFPATGIAKAPVKINWEQPTGDWIRQAMDALWVAMHLELIRTKSEKQQAEAIIREHYKRSLDSVGGDADE